MAHWTHRQALKVLLTAGLLLGLDILFVYLASFGMQSVPGGIAYFFFAPSMIIGDRLAPLYPPGTGGMIDLFIIQFLLMGAAVTVFLALRRRFGSR